MLLNDKGLFLYLFFVLIFCYFVFLCGGWGGNKILYILKVLQIQIKNHYRCLLSMPACMHKYITHIYIIHFEIVTVRKKHFFSIINFHILPIRLMQWALICYLYTVKCWVLHLLRVCMEKYFHLHDVCNGNPLVFCVGEHLGRKAEVKLNGSWIC